MLFLYMYARAPPLTANMYHVMFKGLFSRAFMTTVLWCDMLPLQTLGFYMFNVRISISADLK